MQRILFLLSLVVLAACGQASVPPPAPATAVAVLPPTATLTLPMATPASPTATLPPPTATLTPPMATPDPFADFEQFTIEGLRSRSYGGGSIERVQLLEEAGNFTRWLIAYPSDGLRVTGMLNLPRGDGPFPVVILSHGWYPLDVYRTGDGTRLAADYLAQRGFLTISPDYRSHAGSDDAPNLFRAGHVIDTLNLLPLAQALPEARPGKLLLWGHSNGGAIVAKVLAVSDQVAGALIYAPASSNIVQDYQFRVERSRLRQGQPPGRRTGVIDRLEVEFPVLPEQAPELYNRMSPLNYAQFVSARTLIIWGDQDEIVPRPWPEDLYTSLRDAGKAVTFEVYPGQPHSFTAAGNARYLPAMVEFFRDTLN